MHRLIGHLKSNVIAYLALFLALGAGGGYAVAATRSASIHGCVVTRTGELLVRARCSRHERALELGGVQPGATVAAIGEVSSAGLVTYESGLVIKPAGTGDYEVTVTSRACSGRGSVEFPFVSPVINTGPGVPVVYTTPNPPRKSSFIVSAGQLEFGGFAPGSQGFNVSVTCNI
jgi:hypothetical protein